MTSNVYLKELTGLSNLDQDGKSGFVLVGFEGFTDELGAISTIRPLVLVPRWVEKDPSSFKVFCKGIYDYFNLTRSIADDRRTPKAPPNDFVDLFWEYKFDEENPHSRARNFLRLRPEGRIYMNA